MSEPNSSDDDACACNEEGLVRGSHKRKEIHNEVERRRKDKINIGIFRLASLLPDKDPKKQSKNGILERASNYITYLKSLNEKLVADKVTDVEATIFASLRKQIRELEELNASYVKLLNVAGIPLTSCPEEIWEHAPRKYTLKNSPEKQQALLSAAKALTVPCPQHGSTPVVRVSTGNVCVSVAVTTTTTTACSMGAIATTMAAASTNGMVVTQALPSAPVMSTTQPPAMTMLQQSPLVGPATAGSVMSQPILVLNEQGLPVLQNVVTFQNTSIILNPQGAITRTPVSAVSFPGPEMLPVQMANQLTDDLSHHQVAAQSALGGIMQCDPTKPKETRLCGMHTPVQGTAFLPGTGVVMNQPMLSFGAGAMLAGQNAAPAMGSAFLLPSGQIIPVVTQSQVMAAASLTQHNATSIHPTGGISCVTASNGFVNGMGKVTTAHDSLRVSRSCATTCQDQVNSSSMSSAVSACSSLIVPAGASLQISSKSHATTTCQSVLSSKTVTLHEHARMKTSCVVHSTSKQPLCSIRPKPQQPVPDSSQNKRSCVRKGNKKPLQRSSPESVAKKPRIGDAVARIEMESGNRGLMPLPSAAVTSQPSERVSSTSNVASGMSSKEASPLTTDILAQATESIFSAGLAELPPSSAVTVTRADPCGASNKDGAPQTTVSNADSQGDASSSAIRTYGTTKSVERQKASSRLEALSNSEPSEGQNAVQPPPKRSDIFHHASEITSRSDGACVEQQVTETSVLKDVNHSVQDTETGNRERRDLSTLSLHSIVMEENIDISPSVSSTTFTDSYVSASNSLSESITKMSDCTTSILCQLTPPSSKNSEDGGGGGKAFVSSTDSLASENELPLILSIPDDDGHASLNSNSNPGLSFPPLSPGDQLEQELGNSNKVVESSNNLPPFSLTPPVTPVVTTAASPILQHQDLPPITVTPNKEKKSHEGSFSVSYTTDVSDAYSSLRNQVQTTQPIGGGRKQQQQQQQGCQHNTGALQLQSLPASKPSLDTSHQNASFVSSAPTMPQMHARSPHFSMASNSIMRSFETEFTAPKDLDTSLHCNKPPPSPCRMARDNSRSATPNKTQSSQFTPPLNPYQGTPTSFPCTYHLSSRGNINSTAQSHSAISNYSAEALIGLSTSQPQSLYQLSPACTQESGLAQMLPFHHSSRAHISYSAESLIQSQSTNSKKDSSKDASFSGSLSLGGRQPSYQPSIPHQNMHHVPASTPQASQQPVPSPAPSSVTPENRQHALHPSSSCTTGNASYHTVVSAPSQQSHQPNPSAMTRVHSESRPRSQRTPSSTCATVSTSYHSVASTAQQSQRPSPAPCAVTSESRTHTLHPLPPSSCGSLGTYHMTPAQRSLAGTPVRYPPQPYKDNVPHSSSCASQLPQHMSHNYQQNSEKNPVHGMMAQNYPYPNFSTGHQSSSCFGPYPPPPPPTSVGRVNSSCLQTSSRQASFGGPTPGGQQHQQQGCLFSSTGNSPIISLPPDLGAQCSGSSPVFSSLPQHCSQPPHLVNNLIPTPFPMSGAQPGNSVPPPILGEVEKRREKGVTDGGHCAEAEKQSKSSKSKKGKSSSSMTTPVAPPYFPDFSRSESHPPPLPPVSSSLQNPLHSASPAWQQSKPSSHCISDNGCGPNSLTAGPLFRPQSQNSINLNFHTPGPPPFSVNHHHHHHHSPTQRGPQVAPNAMPGGMSQGHRGNCAVAPSHHVPNFNLSNIFPDIGTGPNDAVISLGAPVKLQLQQEHGAGVGQQSRGASAHFYPSGRVLHNSFNPILPPHNNFVPPSHHPPSFSNVIPPLSFPMHEH